MRSDGRMQNELRPLSIERDYTRHAAGSVLVRAGETRVLCTAMIEDRVPRHCMDEQIGWVTAEYAMLPASTPDRRSLQRSPGGRTKEIQRLIGRSLRMAVDLGQLWRHTIWVDCCVLQADGGTRTASVTGGFVALVDALWELKEAEEMDCIPLKHGIAAVSAGIVEGLPMLDLAAAEDQTAAVDLNVIMNHAGGIIEIQGTAEREPLQRNQLNGLLNMVGDGIDEIARVQKEVLGEKLEL